MLRLMGLATSSTEHERSPDSQTSDLSVAATRQTVLDAGFEGHRRTKVS